MTSKYRPARMKGWLQVLAAFLLGTHFSVSVLAAHPGLHLHPDDTVPRNASAHGDASSGGALPHGSAQHDHGSCPSCHVQSALTGIFFPDAPWQAIPPVMAFSLAPYSTTRSFLVPIASLRSRAPPSLLCA
jgi:hypothetical protein